MLKETDVKFKLLYWYNYPDKFFNDTFNLEPFPYQARIMMDLKNLDIKRMLLMGAGGVGKTKLLASIGLWTAVPLSTYLNYPLQTVIISGSDDQSRYLYDYMRDAIFGNEILSSLVMGEPLKTRTVFRKPRSTIRALPNSLKAIQGKHGNLIIVDEAKLAGNFIIKDTFRMISTSKYDRVILSGTPMNEGTGYLFIEYWEDEERYPDYSQSKKSLDWKRYHFSYLDCPLMTNDKYNEAKKKYDEAGFDIFVLGKPHQIEGTFLPLESIKKISRDNPIFKYNPEGDEPVMGLDLGGYKNPADLTIRQTVDGIDYIIYREEKMIKKDPSEILEWVNGIFEQFYVKRIYCDSNPKGEVERLIGMGLPINSQVMNKVKTKIQANMRRKILNNLVRIPEEYVKLLWQLRNYDWDTKENDDAATSFMCSLIDEEMHKESEIYIKTARTRRRGYTI